MQQVRHQSAGARNPGTKFPRRGGGGWGGKSGVARRRVATAAIDQLHRRDGCTSEACAIKPAEFEKKCFQLPDGFTFRQHERQLQTRPPVLTGFPRMRRSADGTASAGRSWRWTCRISFSTHFYVDFLLTLKRREPTLAVLRRSTHLFSSKISSKAFRT